MISDYYVLAAILEAQELNLIGESLRNFVQSSTSCTFEQFDKIYTELQEIQND